MNTTLTYVSLSIGALLLIGIGLIVDRVGGFAIRTDDVSSSISLSFSQPSLRGVPLTIRWQGQQQGNFAVTMQLISPSGTVVLGSGKLFSGSMHITIPCALPESPARLELIDTSTRAILASSPIDILPPGPDCVR